MKDSTEIRLWLIKTVAEQLNQALETMAGESPMAESSIDAPFPDGDVSYWEISLTLAPGSTILLAATGPAWMDMGGRVLTAAGLEECDEETILSTFRETLDQAFSGLAQSATAQVGREVTASQLKAGSYSPKDTDRWSCVELVFSDAKSIAMSFLWSEKLIAGVLDQPPQRTQTAGASPKMAASGASPPFGRTADVLYDVELPVAVSFGRAHLQLKDVMKLTTGSIVELNRAVAEPVEIIVNNCVVARGEVVVIEGNFGVRIDEVISRQERLRTLH